MAQIAKDKPKIVGMPFQPEDLAMAANQAQRAKPTDDELGDELIQQWNGEYAFLYGAWHKYAGGVWTIEKRTEMHFWRVLIANKSRGIKPNAGKASSVEKYCQLRLMVDDEKLAGFSPYVNVRNGLFNLETMELEAHQRDLFMTSQLPFDFDLNAECPTWERFLSSVLCDENGSPDNDLIDLVQEAFYYSLTSDTSFRVSFWLVGASGTGKSTLVNTLIALAGDSHTAIDLDSLAQNPYQLAEVAGKRVITFSEPDSRQPLADGVYKKLVSKDPITARSPYGKPFTFVPVGKIWGSMNDTPRVSDRSEAVFGRVIIIPMNRVIKESEKDYSLEAKLNDELAGIFNWAMMGGLRLRMNGHFTRSAQSDAARAQYRMENDIEAAFLADCCEHDPNGLMTADELHSAYKTWCTDSGYFAKGKIAAGKEWKRLGLVPERGSGGKTRYWRGVTIPPLVLEKK